VAIRTRTTKSGIVYYVETRGTWERVGSDKREADRLNARRKKEVKAGTFQPRVTGGVSVGRYLAKWLDEKTNRSAGQDRIHIETHVLTRDWFAKLKMEDVRPPLVQRLVNEIKAGPPTLSGKYIANIFGSVRAAFRTALRQEVIQRDVCLLEPGTINKKTEEQEPYSLADARALLAIATGDRLVWMALAFYTGMRCGEVCGRRWRDWDRESLPLGCLTIKTQYRDDPLKTDRPRGAPVHPDLARLLTWWWDTGFELVYLRKPTAEDFIVPRLDSPSDCLNRWVSYKAIVRDCKRVQVEPRGQHATRHTFLTQARRGGAQRDVIERVTHNKKGEMVDHYTHWEWEPLCKAVLCLPSMLSETAPGNAAPTGNLGGNGGYALPDASSSCRGLSPSFESLTLRVLESEPENKHLRDTISEAVSEVAEERDFRAALEDAAERGLRGARPLAKGRSTPYVARKRGAR
jgi:integrase